MVEKPNDEAAERRRTRTRIVALDLRNQGPASAFVAREVVTLARMGSYDTLDYWATRGVLEPSLEPANGIGSQRRYSFTDVVAARVAISLRAQGVGFQSLRRIVRRISTLRDSVDRPLEDAWLVASGRNVFVTYDREDLSTLVQFCERGLLWLIVQLDPIVREIRDAIARMARGHTRRHPLRRRGGVGARPSVLRPLAPVPSADPASPRGAGSVRPV
jgi:DNA-binding transcriptional MerR regulator